MSGLEGFATMPRWILHDSRVPANCKLILMYFSSRQGVRGIFPSQPLIAEELGMSESTVKRSIEWLRSEGYVTVTVETTATGRRNNYALSFDRRGGGVTRDLTLMGDEVTVTQPIRSVRPENESQLNDKNTRSPAVTSPFESWWSLYPRKIAKADAAKAWNVAVEKAPPDVITAALRRQIGRLGEDLRFCPYPATWLRRESWADEPSKPIKKSEPSMKGFR